MPLLPPSLSRFLDNDELRVFAPGAIYPPDHDGSTYGTLVDYGLYDRIVQTYGEGAAWALLAEKYPRNPRVAEWQEKAIALPSVFALIDDEAEVLATSLPSRNEASLDDRLAAWAALPYAELYSYGDYMGMQVTPWLFVALHVFGLFEPATDDGTVLGVGVGI